jgi:hypothetical protein
MAGTLESFGRSGRRGRYSSRQHLQQRIPLRYLTRQVENHCRLQSLFSITTTNFLPTVNKLVYATYAERLLLSACNYIAAYANVLEIPVNYVRHLGHFRSRCSVPELISLTLYSVGTRRFGCF